jgi:ABC-type dipeptide/oligopeptide/nickel transport system ATPase component
MLLIPLWYNGLWTQYSSSTWTNWLDENSASPNSSTGCVYYDRCPFAFEKCKEHPTPIEIEPGHFVACWKVSGS